MDKFLETAFILSQKDPLKYFLPVFAILLLLEFFASQKNQKENYFKVKDTVASITMGFVTLFIGLTMKALWFLAFTFIFQFAIFPDLSNYWWSWIILFFLDDFIFYWHHRLSHEVRILWAAHVNHHSSEYYNLGTALRQSWTEQIYKFIFWAWLPLIGFSPIMILTIIAINIIYQFFPHTEYIKKLPRAIEFIFNTPSHHRVHHASNIRYLDRNHAGVLIIWDRIFGSFQEENDAEKPVYGITSNIKTYNPVRIAFHEFVDIFKDVVRAPGLLNKLKYVFMPPGWSHNGPNQTAKALQNKLNE